MKITTSEKIFNQAMYRAYREDFGSKYPNMRYIAYFQYTNLDLIREWAVQFGLRPYSKGPRRYVQLRKRDWYITNQKKYLMFIMQYSG